MKIMRIAALTALLAATFPVAARAQLDLDFTPFTGATFFLSNPPEQFRLGHAQDGLVLEDARFRRSFTLGFDVGVVFDDQWALEGMASWLPADLTARSGLKSTARVNAYMYGLTALYYVRLDGPVDPFFGLGVGGESFDYGIAGIDTHNEWMGNAVLGFRYAATDRFGLRLEARDCIARFNSNVTGVDNGWENDLMTTIGFSFRTSLR